VMVMMIAVTMVAVPVMVIRRTVRVARVDAKRAIHTANRTPHRTPDNAANRASGVAAFRRAALHSAKNALRLSGNWRGDQGRDHGYSKFLPHRYVSILSASCG
jgi:hypothetical protein